MYDNAKLIAAIEGWLKKSCKTGFGTVYSGQLLSSFEDYCQKTSALQASPGIVAFGREMSKLGFGRKRVNGLQHMTGIQLKGKITPVEERRQAKTLQAGLDEEKKRKKRASKKKASIHREVKNTKQDAAVLRRMRLETKERNQAAGEK